jgi:succinate dehydrogenase/fumarate reductase flavoprotein subunit
VATWARFTVPFKLLLYFNGRMYNNQGERFMSAGLDQDGAQHARYISRGIYHEIREGRGSARGTYTSAAHESRSFIEAHLKEYRDHQWGR